MTLPLLQELSAELGIGPADLLRIITTAPVRYKVYQIPKRRGGARTIAQPSRDLKLIQRFILRNKLVKFPVHAAALGYVVGKNIRDNAQLHKNNRIILKLDFADFFPSLKVGDWEAIARRMGIRSLDLLLYSKILFWGNGTPEPNCLSIGAPTSPLLSNIIMYDIDRAFVAAAQRLGVVYTRYADDITVSGSSREILEEFEQFARRYIFDALSPRLTFNESKCAMFGPGIKRMVTGLVITPNANISIGRERKRRISAMLHKMTLGQLDAESLSELKGLLAFCKSVEPTFIDRLRSKYGNDVLSRVFTSWRRRRTEGGNDRT